NQWYKKGIPNAIPYQLENDLSINILTLPYFIGCKLEALFDRGMADLRLSKDLEDIIFLVHYIPKFVEEIAESEDDLKAYIKSRFAELKASPQLNEAIFCVLPTGENDPDNVKQALAVLNDFIHLQ
ncbi:MAG: hypothetical protein JWN76_1363, partial [Chitinophagaceae bacterium]|nr:hypothetical protein [Chitinophagaceae bacterium]